MTCLIELYFNFIKKSNHWYKLDTVVDKCVTKKKVAYFSTKMCCGYGPDLDPNCLTLMLFLKYFLNSNND